MDEAERILAALKAIEQGSATIEQASVIYALAAAAGSADLMQRALDLIEPVKAA